MTGNTASSPRVSAIIPVYNGAEFLPGAIESISNQSVRPEEIIVVDDGSTDATADIARAMAPDVIYVHQANQGYAGAKNTGIRSATGDYVGLLDVDDRWPEDRLAIQLEAFRRHPEAEAVFGLVQHMVLVDGTGRHAFRAFKEPVLTHSLGAGLFRRSLFDELGLLDTTMPRSSDSDLIFRIRESGIETVTLPQVTLYYHLHDTNMTKDMAATNRGLAEALKKKLDRRRAQERKNQRRGF